MLRLGAAPPGEHHLLSFSNPFIIVLSGGNECRIVRIAKIVWTKTIPWRAKKPAVGTSSRSPAWRVLLSAWPAGWAR